FVSRETKRKRELSLIGTIKIRQLMDKGRVELKISWVWNEEQLHRTWNNLFYPLVFFFLAYFLKEKSLVFH
ncbi:hypothetical protein, partial [Lactococcus lactis]|uniref:hypothetical protein n=1 Tax=Lactococcus lactis TaxID=1358 RepID=UPI0025A2C3E8